MMNEVATTLQRSVCRTIVRKSNSRDFLVQLSKTDLLNPLFKNATWVILEKKFPAFNRKKEGYGDEISAVRIKAKLHRIAKKDESSRAAEGTVRMDQTLRVALGAMTQEDCSTLLEDGVSPEDTERMNQVSIAPFNTKRSLKDRFMGILHTIVGTQPLVMRVRYSLYSDMEIPVCRIPPNLFTVLGISEGEFVEISAIDKKDQSENKTVVRVLGLESADIEKRQHEVENKGNFYPDISGILGLSLLKRENSDLPWIFLDYERRSSLDVWPGDVVRVCRSSRHLLWKRAVILAVPALVGITSWVLEVENVDFKWRAMLLGFCLAVVPLIVIYQIRKEIM